MTNAVSIAQSGSNNQTMRNRIINGAMTIDQRNAGALVSNANGYITDRWSLGKFDPTGGAYSGQQVTDAPSGFTNSLKVTVTTSITQSSDQFWQAFQTIEGYNVADLAWGTASAQPVTVSFWVKSSVTGTYSITLFNSGVGSVDRAYVTTYVINSANTWEYKTVTVAGDTSSASYWGTTNGAGIGVYFDLGCGTNQQATANTWTTANARRVSGTVRLMATGSATWQITGVQLEEGTAASPFENRLYGTELALCQRYCMKWLGNQTNEIISGGAFNAYSSTNAQGAVAPPVTMRSTPTITFGTLGFTDIASINNSVSALTINTVNSGPNAVNMTVTSTGMTTGRTGYLYANGSTSAFLIASAEL